MTLGTPIKKAVLGNGFHISGTRFAIDYLAVKDEDTSETTFLWRLLQRKAGANPDSYEVVCVDSNRFKTIIALIGYYTQRDSTFYSATSYRQAFDSLLSGCEEATELIWQQIHKGNEQNG